ncbi:hypothetical protein WA158_002858 [Blastocystis sp. Blastoise]
MFIQIVSEGSSEKKWIIVELQGSLHQNDDLPFEGQAIGYFSEEEGRPILTIGNHLCEGKLVHLSKPIAILEKVPLEEDTVEENEKPVEYRVKVIVYEKFLFSSRPRPIFNSARRKIF